MQKGFSLPKLTVLMRSAEMPRETRYCFDGAGTTVAESKVVFGGAALVAMTFDGDALGRIVAQILRRLTESGASIRANVGLVEVEVGVLHVNA